MKIRNKSMWIGVLILITIEQVIKIVIRNNYLNKKFPILPPVLYFEPMFNRRYSWFNSMLQLDGSKWIHIVMVSIASILMYLFYKFINRQLGTHRIINIMFAFIFSGAICSLIDKVFWDGSLDYVLVNGFFTFDLKDVYINVFIGLLVLSMLLKNKVIKQIEEKKLVNEFPKYILGKL